jgi:hypothetical protein
LNGPDVFRRNNNVIKSKPVELIYRPPSFSGAADKQQVWVLTA